MAYLPISVPAFNLSGVPLTTDVDFMIKALPSGDYFDFGSEYGGTGDNTFKVYAAAVSPKLRLGKIDVTNLDGYYSIMLGGSQVPLNLVQLPDGEYLLLGEALAIVPNMRFVNQIGVIDGRLAETVEAFGAGISKLTVIVKEINAAGAPVPNATVVVRTPGGSLAAHGTTNTFGEVELHLEPGNYKVYLNQVGIYSVFSNPYDVTVEVTDTRVELYGSPGGPEVPTPPGTTRVYGYLADLGVDPRPDVAARAWVEYPDEVYTTGSIIISGSKTTVLTNNEGYFHFDLVPQKFLSPEGVIYALEIHEADFHVNIAATLLDVGGALSLADLGVY
jgi:hypothetical protein